jgi:hypothetical protein
MLTAGIVSLTGCSALSAVGVPAPSPTPTAVAGIDPSTVTAQSEFVKRYGQRSAVPAATAGLRFLEVAFTDHPEFTLATFEPTQEIWDKDVAPKLKGLVADDLYQKAAAAWTTEHSADGYTGRLLNTNRMVEKSPNGERVFSYGANHDSCTLTDTQPFKYTIRKTEVAGSDPAAFDAFIDTTIPCKEGKEVAATEKIEVDLGSAGPNQPWQVTGYKGSQVGDVAGK